MELVKARVVDGYVTDDDLVSWNEIIYCFSRIKALIYDLSLSLIQVEMCPPAPVEAYVRHYATLVLYCQRGR